MLTTTPDKAQLDSILERERAKRDAEEATLAPLVEARVEARVEAEVAKRTEGANVSAMRRRVMGLIAQQSAIPDISPFLVPGDPEPWYVARLGVEGLARVGMLCERDSRQNILIQEKGQFSALMAAMFFVAVCDEKGRPLFESLEEAYAMATKKTREAVLVGSHLFKAFMKVNPEIFADNKEQVEEAVRHIEEDDFLGRTEMAAESST